MVRVVGMDPGTKSLDLCGLEDGRLILDVAIPTEELARDPSKPLEALRTSGPFDLIVAPSGYGLPLTHISRVGEGEEFLMRLVKPRDPKPRRLVGLGKLIKLFRGEGLNAFFIPGVKHLPTVPSHRKANRIDMGTADKLCAVALSIHNQSKRLKIPYTATRLIHVELGFGFNAFVGVEGGRVVDGVGGSGGGPGFLSLGGMDSELAYLLGGFGKDVIFSGGVADIAGMAEPNPELFASTYGQSERGRMAFEAFVEGVVKGVAAMAVSVPQPLEVVLSGRLCGIPPLFKEVYSRLSGFGRVVRLRGFAKRCKEAAQGAALIADGLAGGEMKPLVDALGIRESGGSVLDHIYVEGFEKSPFK